MFLGVRSRPIRIILRWQVIVTAALTLAAAMLWGAHGAVSAALGGLVIVVSGWVSGWLGTRRKTYNAGAALRTMLRAEGTRILLIIVLLWLVLANYREIVVVGFLATFVITVLVSTAAIVVKDTRE